MRPGSMLVRPLTPDDAGAYVALRREMLDDAPWAFAASPESDFALEILSAALDIARSWPGVTSVGLSVSERADAALRLYQRLGFVQWGVEPAALMVDGRAYDEVHMVAVLDRAASHSAADGTRGSSGRRL